MHIISGTLVGAENEAAAVEGSRKEIEGAAE